MEMLLSIRAGSVLYSSVLGPDTGTHAVRALSCGPSLQKATCPLPFSVPSVWVPKHLLKSPPSSGRAGWYHGAKAPLMGCGGTQADTQQGWWGTRMLRREQSSSGQQKGHLGRSQNCQLALGIALTGISIKILHKRFQTKHPDEAKCHLSSKVALGRQCSRRIARPGE